MPFRSMTVLQRWVDEFKRLDYPAEGSIRVIPQDGELGADTGLVAVRLMNSPTEIYLEPPAESGLEWTIVFEAREEPVRLGASQVRELAAGLATLSALCAFLQQKSDDFSAELRIS